MNQDFILDDIALSPNDNNPSGLNFSNAAIAYPDETIKKPKIKAIKGTLQVDAKELFMVS